MTFAALRPLVFSGKEVLPLVEGGKGIAATDGQSSGAWAAAGGIGTVSAVNAHIPGHPELAWLDSYSSAVRQERHQELIQRAIRGGIEQIEIAAEKSNNQGRIHINVLWEMGGTEEVLHGILSKVHKLVHGVTCGAGMPFRLAEICASYNLKYYPIVSSARAFEILWKRAYHKFTEWLGGIVYEDPWLAGGHNGLSSNEDERVPEAPEPRVRLLRSAMRAFGLDDLVPIIMAGGVWWLSEWEDWINNPELGAIAFQFGTRPLLTQESPIPAAWKNKLMTLKPGDVALNRFSPTGFPSSAVKNTFLRQLQARSERQVPFVSAQDDAHPVALARAFLSEEDAQLADQWIQEGFSVPLKTPSGTLVFVRPEEQQEIIQDRLNCVGCLSACKFSGWTQSENHPITPDPRLFCIQKSLQLISLREDADNALMFCGHQGYRFAQDPFYANGFVPTVQQLIDQILTGK